jgi:hypothetical protein
MSGLVQVPPVSFCKAAYTGAGTTRPETPEKPENAVNGH